MNRFMKEFCSLAIKIVTRVQFGYVRSIGGGRLSSYNKAFTLAEVLITLAIIGVVAAMTMPSLIQKYQEQKRVTQLKKHTLLCKMLI